jgi:hypothetical protein
MKMFKTQAPHPWFFIIAGVLALFGTLEYLWVGMPRIGGITNANAFWFITLGWLLLAIGCLFKFGQARRGRRKR